MSLDFAFRLTFAMVVIALVVLLSSYPSDATRFRSRHMKRKEKHSSHRRHLDRAHNHQHQNDQEHHVTKRETRRELLEETLKQLASEADQGQSEILPGSSKKLNRRKRSTFAWPPETFFITEFSMEMPLYAPSGVAVPFLIEVPYEFDMPNITDKYFTTADDASTESEARSAKERFTFFSTIESLFSRFGFNGRSCMLRAICERAESDVLTHGLLGEVINLILAVSTTGTESNSLMEYMDAEHHGRHIGDCSSKFSTCPISVFHFFE